MRLLYSISFFSVYLLGFFVSGDNLASYVERTYWVWLVFLVTYSEISNFVKGEILYIPYIAMPDNRKSYVSAIRSNLFVTSIAVMVVIFDLDVGDLAESAYIYVASNYSFNN